MAATFDNSDYFGVGVSAIGDLNNDGIVDVAIGAYLNNDGGTDRGALYIIFPNYIVCPQTTYISVSTSWSGNQKTNSCVLCPAGRYSLNDAIDCIVCPAGKYSSTGASECKVCPVGHYCPPGSSTYVQCPAGTVAASGSSICTSCLTSQYSTPGSLSCQTCLSSA
jgi:hypothetical protein